MGLWNRKPLDSIALPQPGNYVQAGNDAPEGAVSGIQVLVVAQIDEELAVAAGRILRARQAERVRKVGQLHFERNRRSRAAGTETVLLGHFVRRDVRDLGG